MIEILVAVTVFLLLAVILVSIAGSLSAVWQRGIAHNERRAAALAAFGRMARDLQHAALPTDQTASNLQFIINPTAIGQDYELPQAAFWRAPVASDRTRGDLALVGYFIRWVNETQGGPVPKLCRLLVNPSSPDFQYGKPADWLSESLLASNAPATKQSGYRGQLAENVLGLWMRPLDQNRNPITRNADEQPFGAGQFDSALGYSVEATNAAGIATTNVFTPALPASVEVAIVTVDSRTAKRLTGSEKPGVPTGDMWLDVNTFMSNLPPPIRQGAAVHNTVINLFNAPK